MLSPLRRYALTLVAAGTVFATGCGGPAPAPAAPAGDTATTATDASNLFGALGVKEPDDHWERYRRAEYPSDRSFYQWWFFTVRDPHTGRYFAFTYAMLDAVAKPTARAARAMFTMTDRSAGTKFRKTESFPLEQLTVHNDFDVEIFNVPAAPQPSYTLTALGDGTYRLQGQMVGPASAAAAEGTLRGQPVDPGVLVTWDLVVRRIYGWYGQNSLEGLTHQSGTISWNTYAHESRVSGTIQVGDETITVDDGPNWRAYCDMNWGIEFPHGQPGEDPTLYPWGWYYVARPAAAAEDELSLITGTATQHLTDIETGSFADFRLGRQGNFQFIGAEILKPSPSQGGIKIYNSSDSVGTAYDVQRDDWAAYTDPHGTAMIPLHQKVSVRTLHYDVTLDFYSQLEEYNRLPFVAENYVFSDFEALGVDVHTTVTYKPLPFSKPQVLEDFWTNTGGLEFGYQAPFEP